MKSRFCVENLLRTYFWGILNVNSTRNKFEALEVLMKGEFDVFLVSESKLDSSL